MNRTVICVVGLLMIVMGFTVVAEPTSPFCLYVDADRPDDSGDGLTWGSAFKSLQAAIDHAALEGTEIVVTNGVYAPIATGSRLVTIQSVNGADVTTIDGGGASRCATLGSSSWQPGATLIGFTLANGCAAAGGGAYCGKLENCTLTGNEADYGGAAYDSILRHCVVSGNKATFYGGGLYLGSAANCVMSQNTADSGGGAYDAILECCTLAGNTAHSYSGGVYGGFLVNCIVWGNLLNTATDNHDGALFSYSCTSPLPDGPGNIAGDPKFTGPASGNFRLLTGSPCVNAGDPAYLSAGVDLDGNTRIMGGRVDMGAYEFDSSTQTHTVTTPVPVPYVWLDDYRPWQGVSEYEALANLPGANGLFFWESYVAGLIPTNPNSRFLITNLVVSAQSTVTALDWNPHRSDRLYTVWGKTNLTDGAWHSPTNSATRFFKVTVEMP